MGSRGVDVSSYQRPADWRGLAPNFVIIKASEGEHTVDARFHDHLGQAQQLHTLAGAYHFGWPVNSPQADAENFVRQLGDTVKSGAIRFVGLDVESYPDNRNVKGMTAKAIKHWGESWAAFVRAQLRGVKVGAYADLHHYGAGWVPAGMDYHWVAEYRGGMTYSRAEASDWPNIGPGYSRPLFWQFNSSPLDMNICPLDVLELNRFFGRTSTPAPPAHSSSPAPTYKVVAGDTLSGIAVRHGISLADLEHANPQIKNPDVIHVGQVLKLPHGAQELPKATTYKVRKGDTLSEIAQAHGVTLTALERANPQIKNPNLILIGQVLHIPAKG